MKYVCLIYGDEAALQKMSKEEMDKLAADSKAFHKALQESGQFVAYQGLGHANTATTVRVREGKTMMTGGPFAETKDILGSIYVIEAKDLNDATRVAAKFPSARVGSIEVRPAWEWR
ncbi:MAG: YciI family protein [Chloroflexi bacterium]|nr:YciI family protein [Chloroflexota bacterium]